MPNLTQCDANQINRLQVIQRSKQTNQLLSGVSRAEVAGGFPLTAHKAEPNRPAGVNGNGGQLRANHILRRSLAERHNQIIRRIEAVLIAVKKLEPIESLAEKRMKNELSEVEKKLVVYEKSIKQLKDKLDFQKFEVGVPVYVYQPP